MSESAEVKAGGMNASLRVIVIDDESTNIARVLGISEEREDQLEKIIQEIYRVEDSTITDSFVEISKNCRHANELAYCCFHVGVHNGKNHVLKALSEDGLTGLLAKALGSSKKNPGKSSENND